LERKIKEFSLTTFEVWCYKARDYFGEINDEVGSSKIEEALQMIDIFRQYNGELFFMEGE